MEITDTNGSIKNRRLANPSRALRRAICLLLCLALTLPLTTVALAAEGEDWDLYLPRHDASQDLYVLTEDNTTYTAGSMWSKLQYTGDFTLELDYYTGVKDRPYQGADGISIVFYSAAPTSGMGANAVCPGGYALELDTYVNGEFKEPLSTNHIALTKGKASEHLASAALRESEDGKWHHLKLELQGGTCSAWIDNSLRLTASAPQTGYGWLGIGASTGAGTNLHAVKNVSLSGTGTKRPAVSEEPVEWRFLFAVFSNYISQNGTRTTMTQEELDAIQYAAQGFEDYMESFGYIRPTVETVIIDTPLQGPTPPADDPTNPRLHADDAYRYLKDQVDLDTYDHVTVFANMAPDKTDYWGFGGSFLPNGTGYSFMNTISRDLCLKSMSEAHEKGYWPPAVPVHEFLHFTESLGRKLGQYVPITCHDSEQYGYKKDDDDFKVFYTDLITRQVKGADGSMLGVSEMVWRFSPRMLRALETQTPPPVQQQPETVGGFSDVHTTDYYAESVQWAVAQEITAETSKTIFSPEEDCTTAQVLTFLWRANGSPEPAAASFPGLTGEEYYAKAVRWAAEKGLIDGTVFVDAPCTRAQCMTYQWILAGKPSAAPAAFSDVPSNATYAQAVAWAVENGVTSGTSRTTFSPDATCTRAQIVTFLYRAR